jgi:CheY-like chemotaxis protein
MRTRRHMPSERPPLHLIAVSLSKKDGSKKDGKQRHISIEYTVVCCRLAQNPPPKCEQRLVFSGRNTWLRSTLAGQKTCRPHPAVVPIGSAARLVAADGMSTKDMIPAGRVLVVDDDPDVRTVVAAILADAGALVLEVGSACDALALLRATSCIALLLTDIVMPGMNGIHLAKSACAIQPALKVMFMTGYTSQALPSGAVVLLKPFRAEELTSVVGYALQAA